MIRKLIKLAIVAVVAVGLHSCVKDTSAYLPQDKESVTVDADVSDGGDDPTFGENELIPGINSVEVDVTLSDGTVEKRNFKYYMPVSIDASKPISLIFEFHGSIEYPADSPAPNPIQSIAVSNPLNQLAIRQNAIVVFPAGIAELSDGAETGYVNWQDSERSLVFVDAMLDFFKTKTPLYSFDNVFSTGQSSGAIFSFYLAYNRPNDFAAVAPRAGQMSLASADPYTGSRSVPILAFNGVDDTTVSHSAAVNNMIAWTNKVGGYFESDMQYNETDTLEIAGYKMYQTRTWSGARADYQVVSLLDEGHGVSLYYVTDLMWSFFATHTINNESTPMYISASHHEVELYLSQSLDIDINFPDGATVTFDAPSSWSPELNGKVLSLKAPSDFYANGTEGIGGEIVITADLGGIKASRSIKYKLIPPKDYFEVGDIYMDSNFEPVGVVCWVDPTDLRKAKVLSIEVISASYGTGLFGDRNKPFSANFESPSETDGETNTKAIYDDYVALYGSELSPTVNIPIWTYLLSVGGYDNWYLPAIDEYKEIYPNVEIINEKITELGGKYAITSHSQYSSTVKKVATGREFYYFSFTTGVTSTRVVSNDYVGYVSGRAIMKVSK